MNHPIVRYILLFSLLLPAHLPLRAQVINWGNLQDGQRHWINAHTGAQYGMVFGLGYAYQLADSEFPVIANAAYSFPSGNNLLDDFKAKLGTQVRLLQMNDFHFAVKAHGIFRGYENELVRLLNWGMDLSGTIGYYRPSWFVAGEAGFDKAISTRFKHTDTYKKQYPDVKDGWYAPATGGNFNYGLQGGVSFGRHDITLSGGGLLQEDFKKKPLLPFYLLLGYNYRW
ncbi:hypothetical protein SAMN04488128_1011834 [Chitinophaga eiseniae]|uniref:Outer membrane protein beta-barrel domain-containing protein n=1 Tax=Chitinophaga eiseniae TaxID=634771 RepID=A0A1T4NZU1_9BACT|nr:hypothetical protein [Chitinophaga eiseniae]SJZ84711.1 hypothetical protein SAMN04488128_1011834 [Chitinophaga eiseniae]